MISSLRHSLAAWFVQKAFTTNILNNSLTIPLFLVLSRRPGRSLTKSQRMCHTYIFSQQEVVAYSQTWRGSTENLGNVGRLTTWARTSLRILLRGWSLLLVNTKIPHMCQFWFRLIVSFKRTCIVKGWSQPLSLKIFNNNLPKWRWTVRDIYFVPLRLRDNPVLFTASTEVNNCFSIYQTSA